MKNKVLFTLLMLAGLSCIAQNSHKKFKIETSTVIEEMKQSMDGDYSDVFSSVWNFNYDSSASVMLFMYDIKRKSYSHCKLDMSHILSYDDSYRPNVSSFAVCSSTLVFNISMDMPALYFFEKKGDTFVFDYRFNDKEKLFVRGMHFLPDGHLLGLKNYPHNRDFEHSTKLTLFDTKTRKITKTIDVDFPLPGFTFTPPYNILAVNDSSIFLSQRGDYKISEYDFDLNKKTDIIYKGTDWKRMPQNISDSIIHSTQGSLSNSNIAFNMLYGKYSCIHNICVTNDKLMVFYSKPNETKHYYYDVWRKDSCKWVLTEKAINDKTRSVKHLYEHSLFAFGSWDVNLHPVGEKMLRIRRVMPDLGFWPKLIYMYKLQNYLIDNPVTFVVESISFK